MMKLSATDPDREIEMTVDLTTEEIELIEQALREMKIDLSGYGLTIKPEDVDRLLEKLSALGEAE